MKSLDVKRMEAEQRQTEYNKLTLQQKLERALKGSGGKRTRQVRRLEQQIKEQQS